MDINEMSGKYRHNADDFPVLKEQTRTVLVNRTRKREKININDNLMHYIQDTALLISVIDGSLKNDGGFDHIIYLDKSARPVSWLVNMLWKDFASKDKSGEQAKRPLHTYVNIDRSPWFRNVGINVSDDGRQKANGELATYTDFLAAAEAGKLTKEHLAPLRSLFIKGGIDREDVDEVMKTPTMLAGKKVLIVDEVSRTGSTLSIAKYLFKKAIPEIDEVVGEYFWHPQEAPLMVGNESVLTSLPVWYDPDTLTGRGIGGLNPEYFRKRFDFFSKEKSGNPNVDYDYKKMRTQAFAASVYSAPLLDDEGNVLSLEREKKTRLLTQDLLKMVEEYRAGHILFNPPTEWILSDTKYDESMTRLKAQGVLVLDDDDFDRMSDMEISAIKKSPLYFLNFVEMMKKA